MPASTRRGCAGSDGKTRADFSRRRLSSIMRAKLDKSATLKEMPFSLKKDAILKNRACGRRPPGPRAGRRASPRQGSDVRAVTAASRPRHDHDDAATSVTAVTAATAVMAQGLQGPVTAASRAASPRQHWLGGNRWAGGWAAAAALRAACRRPQNDGPGGPGSGEPAAERRRGCAPRRVRFQGPTRDLRATRAQRGEGPPCFPWPA